MFLFILYFEGFQRILHVQEYQKMQSAAKTIKSPSKLRFQGVLSKQSEGVKRRLLYEEQYLPLFA